MIVILDYYDYTHFFATNLLWKRKEDAGEDEEAAKNSLSLSADIKTMLSN